MRPETDEDREIQKGRDGLKERWGQREKDRQTWRMSDRETDRHMYLQTDGKW